MSNWKQNANWCGLPEGERRKTGRMCAERAYFRRAFVAKKEAELSIHISAVDRYRLYLNGVAVHAGPSRGDRYRHYADTISLTPFLVDGENVLSVVVTGYIPGEAMEQLVQGPVAVISRGGGPLLLLHSKEMPELGTDCAGWQVLGDRATTFEYNQFSGYTAPTEIWKSAAYPRGWMSQNQTLSWQSPIKLWMADCNPYGELPPMPLFDRTIPLLYHKEHSFVRAMPQRENKALSYPLPATVAANSTAVLTLDAGELVCGYFHLKTQGGLGAKLRFTYAESYVDAQGKKGDRCDWEQGDIIGKYDELWPDGGACHYDRQEMHALRFVKIEITTADQPIKLTEVGFLQAGYPLDCPTELSLPEPWMQGVWDISLRTLQRCMHETYTDCPYYEQLQYTQDSRLQMLYTYRSCADPRMARRTLEDYHASMLPEGILQSRYPCQITQVIPNFALHWIFMLEDYYWQTGDAQPIMLYRPTVDAVLSWFERHLTDQQLVGDMPYWKYFDWVESWPHGDPPASLEGDCVATVFSLTYILALRCAARLMAVIHRQGMEQEYTTRADTIAHAVEKHCYSAEQGIYLDGPNRPEHSQHAQVFAVLAGVATGNRAKSVLRAALDLEDMAQCSFTMQYYLFRALEMADMYEETASLWDLWKGLTAQNLTTVPEIPGQSRSDCHAWGSLALYEFPAHFAGLQPAEPGFKSITIKPQALWLDHFGGTFPTPIGNVVVHWEKTDLGLHLWGKVPEGTVTQLLYKEREATLPQGGVFDISL